MYCFAIRFLLEELMVNTCRFQWIACGLCIFAELEAGKRRPSVTHYHPCSIHNSAHSFLHLFALFIHASTHMYMYVYTFESMRVHKRLPAHC